MNDKKTKKYESCLDCGCPIEVFNFGVVGARMRMDNTGKFLGPVCDLCHFEIKREDLIYEWGFPEPSICVDLERLCAEASGIPVIHAKVYMNELKVKAPIVYGRLKAWAKQNNKMQWVSDFNLDNS